MPQVQAGIDSLGGKTKQPRPPSFARPPRLAHVHTRRKGRRPRTTPLTPSRPSCAARAGRGWESAMARARARASPLPVAARLGERSAASPVGAPQGSTMRTRADGARRLHAPPSPSPSPHAQQVLGGAGRAPASRRKALLSPRRRWRLAEPSGVRQHAVGDALLCQCETRAAGAQVAGARSARSTLARSRMYWRCGAGET